MGFGLVATEAQRIEGDSGSAGGAFDCSCLDRIYETYSGYIYHTQTLKRIYIFTYEMEGTMWGHVAKKIQKYRAAKFGG